MNASLKLALLRLIYWRRIGFRLTQRSRRMLAAKPWRDAKRDFIALRDFQHSAGDIRQRFTGSRADSIILEFKLYRTSGPVVFLEFVPKRPPGSYLVALAGLLSKRSALRRIVEQSVADMREEHIEAIKQGRLAMGRWIVVRGWLSTIWAVTIQIGLWSFVWRVASLLNLDK